MSRRRKHPQQSRYHRERTAQPDPVIDMALAQLFRRECSDCGFDRLRWFAGADAADVIGAAAAERLLAQMPVEWRDDAECWTCPRCGEFGAFGPSEWEPF